MVWPGMKARFLRDGLASLCAVMGVSTSILVRHFVPKQLASKGFFVSFLGGL